MDKDAQKRSPGRWIATLFRRSRLFLDRAFEPAGLGRGFYLYLALVSRKEGLSQRQLAQELALDEGTVARALQRLTEEGWLTKERDPKDGRAFRVFLGPKGLSAMPDLLKELQRWDERLLKGFSPSEKKAAVELLIRMAENAEEGLETPDKTTAQKGEGA
ncbi:MAG: MarR family transcriptional regulator [Thermanaerothrix sp.]|nr:MarR family transcriptional regulator [Thermanaerothrix sp.]